MNILEYAIAKKLAGGGSGGGGSSEEAWFNDGDTHIWISLPEGRTSPMLGVCPNGTVTVDWGDNTEPDVLTGVNTARAGVKWTPRHNYAKAGDYVIRLHVNGAMAFSGNDTYNEGAYVLRYSSGAASLNSTYLQMVRKVEVGNYVQSVGSYSFSGACNLTSVVISDSVTSIGDRAFLNAHSLTSIVIPDSVKSIDQRALSNCYNLNSIVIPRSVTSIGDYAFGYCRNLRCVDFSNHIQVPSLAGTNTFYTMPEDCEIRVPAALYDEWKAATNWVKYASQIVSVEKEPDSVVPMYPLNSETYTNTYYGFTASASDGNHVSVEKTTAYDTPVNINLYDMSTNVDVFSNNNHVHKTIFSLKAGDKVLTKKINTAIVTENADFSASNHTIFFRTGDGGSTSLNCYSDCAVGLDVENEITMTSDFDVGSIGFYLSGNARTAIYKLDFDLEIYVNGVRYV